MRVPALVRPARLGRPGGRRGVAEPGEPFALDAAAIRQVAGPYPARWLTHEEAYGRLLGVCDASDVGRRDELLLRLGLAGMRVAELLRLTVGEVHQAEATISWIGKKQRPHKVAIGPAMGELLDDWLERYRLGLGRPITSVDVVVCRQKPGPGAGSFSWGQPFKTPASISKLLRLRAEAAGLGHMSPHDLRRSAGGILHRSMSADGGHQFDLLDIQKVLSHANPATTMRSYIDPPDTGVIGRAAAVLD